MSSGTGSTTTAPGNGGSDMDEDYLTETRHDGIKVWLVALILGSVLGMGFLLIQAVFF